MLIRAQLLPTILLLAPLAACGGADRPPPRVGTTTITAAEAPRAVPHTERRFIRSPRNQDELILTGVEPLPDGQETGEQWQRRYPMPAKMLKDWAKAHPQTASDLARWEAGDPEKPRVFVEWAIGRQYDPVGAFLANRPGWDDFVKIRDRDPEAIEELTQWIRHSQNAASELMKYGSGFSSVVGPT